MPLSSALEFARRAADRRPPEPRPQYNRVTSEIPLDRAVPAWAVEDRNVYWKAVERFQDTTLNQRINEIRQRSLAQLERRKQMQEYLAEQPAVQGLNQARTLFAQAQQTAQVADRAQREQVMRDAYERTISGQLDVEFMRRNPGVEPEYTDITPLEAAYRGLRTKVPGAERVQEAVGDVARASVLPAPWDFIPGVETRGFRRKAGGAIAEALVPTEVWDTALTIIPATKAKTPAQLLSALVLGDEDALRAIRMAGSRAGQRESVERMLRELASEEGAWKPFGRKAGEVVEPAVTSPVVLNALSKAEQARLALKPDVSDVFKIAERYARDSTQRQQLIELATRQSDKLSPTMQKFIRVSLETLPTKAERKLATKAQRIRQMSGADLAFREGDTAQERATAAFKAMGGKQAPRFTPVGDRFTDAESRELFDQIIAHNEAGKFRHAADAPKATSALTLLMTGQRLPGIASEAQKPLNLMPSEIKLLGQVFGNEFAAAIPRTARHQSALATAVDWLNLPRALVTAIDISAAGRQGIVLTARNPVEVARSFPAMIRAMASEEGFARGAQNIRANPKFEEALGHGLELTNIGGGTAAEEAFISTLASRIPGVRMSERGFVMYLDTLRMLTYEKYANRIDKLALRKTWAVERTDLVKAEIARFINHASGRGTIQGAGEFIPAMNAVFFAPRFLVSRPQSVWDMVRPGATATSRQIAFENLGAFVGLGVGMMATARMFGAKVELDPRSSDFGKMRFGNTRIDFWGGFQPIARYIAQFSTGRSKNVFTGDMEKVFWGKTALRFFRSKLAPGGALLYDLTVNEGRNYEGDDTFFKSPGWEKAWTEFQDRLLPLAIQDAIEAYRSEGIASAITAAGVSALGGGVSSFEPDEQEAKTIAQTELEKKLQQAGLPWKDGAFDTSAKYQTSRWQEAFAEDFEVPKSQLAEYESLPEMRAGYIRVVAPKLALPAEEAKAEAGRRFDAMPSVKEFKAEIEAGVMEFWKEHPDLLQEAREAGVVKLGSDARRELGLD